MHRLCRNVRNATTGLVASDKLTLKAKADEMF